MWQLGISWNILETEKTLGPLAIFGPSSSWSGARCSLNLPVIGSKEWSEWRLDDSTTRWCGDDSVTTRCDDMWPAGKPGAVSRCFQSVTRFPRVPQVSVTSWGLSVENVAMARLVGLNLLKPAWTCLNLPDLASCWIWNQSCCQVVFWSVLVKVLNVRYVRFSLCVCTGPDVSATGSRKLCSLWLEPYIS